MKFDEAVDTVYDRSAMRIQQLMMDAMARRALGHGHWIELFLPHAEDSLNDARRWTSEERIDLRQALHLDNSSFRRSVGLPDASMADLSPASRYLEFARSEGAGKLLDHFGRPSHEEELFLIEAQISGELPSDFMVKIDEGLRFRRLEAARAAGAHLTAGESSQEALEAWRRWL